MSFARFPRTALIIASATLLLAACGNDKGKPATQAAARVNDGELTVHQINQLLEQQRGLKPEQVAAASKDALERLIDQELVLQQALENKVDREPRVVALIEAARRDLIVRAYVERLGETITKPSTDEVQAYYNAHPGLFANRRVYTLTEVNVQASPAQVDEVNAQAQASKTPGALLEWLKAKGLEHGANQSVQAAEALPLGVVEAVAATPVGGVLVLPRPQGTKLVFVEAARPEPVSLERARP
ncbi:MAG: EpsD family peptidyl-prolyl cis-trans isomerase, partial [Burkholderiales bacterium]|nr:EpsD family peptidyl-prolyl cis-trans isomerase [Burkholderiales bacterium]